MASQEIADILYRDFITKFGATEILVSDRGRNFIGKLIQNLCKIFQITTYHPAPIIQSNATCERMNKVIAQGIKHHIDQDQSNWQMLLPGIMLAYRTTPATESHQYSPHYLMFGRECRMPIDNVIIPNTGSKKVDDYLHQLIAQKDVAADIAREYIIRAQAKYKTQHDEKYQVGDHVWLHCSRVPVGLSPKFYEKWVGPCYICNVFPNFTYKLRRSSDNHPIKSLVHANRLKPHHGIEDKPVEPPPMFQQDNMECNAEKLDQQIRTFMHQVDLTYDLHDTQVPTQDNDNSQTQPQSQQFQYVVLSCKSYSNDEKRYKVRLEILKISKKSGRIYFLMK